MKSSGVASESAAREAAGAQLSGRLQISTEPSLRFRGKGLMCTGARGDEPQRRKSRARTLVSAGRQSGEEKALRLSRDVGFCSSTLCLSISVTA